MRFFIPPKIMKSSNRLMLVAGLTLGACTNVPQVPVKIENYQKGEDRTVLDSYDNVRVALLGPKEGAGP